MSDKPEPEGPEEEGAKRVLDLYLEGDKQDISLVVGAQQWAENMAQQSRAATDRLAAAFSAVDSRRLDLRLRELAQNLPDLNALIAPKISLAPIMPPELLVAFATLQDQTSEIVSPLAAALQKNWTAEIAEE